MRVALSALGGLTAYALPGIRTLGAGFDGVPNRTSLTTDGVPATQGFDAANRPTTGGYGYVKFTTWTKSGSRRTWTFGDWPTFAAR